MYPQPYVAIRAEVVEVLQGLISKDDPYHYKHARRFARTLEVILDQKPSGKLLEVGTSGVLPKALEILAPMWKCMLLNTLTKVVSVSMMKSIRPTEATLKSTTFK